MFLGCLCVHAYVPNIVNILVSITALMSFGTETRASNFMVKVQRHGEIK